MNRAVLILLTVTFAIPATAFATEEDQVDVTMTYDGLYGQTSVYRGYIDTDNPSTLGSITVTDLNSGGGSSGCFAGFDLDFIFFNRSGVFTDGSGFGPLTDTALTPGDTRFPGQSRFQPTNAHPGTFFGVTTDGTVDEETATLDTHDATYVHGANLAVDTSCGWSTLGDGGQIQAWLPEIPVGPCNGGAYVFIGDAGLNDEFVDATVMVTYNVAEPPVADAGGPYIAYPYYNVSLDGSGSQNAVQWDWTIGEAPHDMVLPPAYNPITDVTYYDLYSGVGIGPYQVELTVWSEDTLSATDQTPLFVAELYEPWNPDGAAVTGGPYQVGSEDEYVQLDGTGCAPETVAWEWTLWFDGDILEMWQGPIVLLDYGTLVEEFGTGVFDLFLVASDADGWVIGSDMTSLDIHTPEPGTLSLLFCGVLVVLRRRRAITSRT